ncbi:DNA integration/recombination/inversion protein, partial [Streptococcus pyogenes]
IYRQCYCGCVYAAKMQGIDLVQVKKDAKAFMADKDLDNDFTHIRFSYRGDEM